MFSSPFSIAITSLGEERANLSDFRTFVRFELVWLCLFPFPLGVLEGLRLVIVALPGTFSYLFFFIHFHPYRTFSVIVVSFMPMCPWPIFLMNAILYLNRRVYYNTDRLYQVRHYL